MKRIYIPLFAVYVFLGATALVAEEAVQPTIEAAAVKPDAAKAQQALAAADAKPEDDDIEELGWPRAYQHEEGEVVIYQPQMDEWKNYTTLTAKAAVSVQFKGSDEFQYGAIYLKATTEVDKDEDEVLLSEVTITKMHFPDIDDELAAKSGDLVSKAIPVEGSIIMSLDRLVADLEADAQDVREVNLNLDPPPIYYSDQPAILLTFMGKPSFKPVEGADGLMFAVNTNWDLLLDISSSTYYLLDDESWMETADPVKGPWKNTVKLPDSFSKLPDDDNWGDVKEHIPGKAAEEQSLVFVATEPSELIETKGEPEFGLVSGTKLMYVTNTDSDLFFDNEDEQFYFLTAGRWFRSENLQGPWEAASADLPEEFANIPEDHEKDDVLSAVPGTPDAEAAVLLASVPQKATVSRKDTTTEIVYEGEPQFEEIKGTSPVVSYAINSPNDVFLVSGLYYALVDGVWFVGSTPTGPWAVATEVDQAIYTIPEESPKYNATYVRVYDSTPDNVVVGYTSGYSGSYVAATGVLMFGLGLWAGSYWGNNRYYGYHYRPHFYGYGCGMRYRYGHGYYRGGRPRLYGPYGGIGGRAGYNPRTGRYYRGGVARGPYGSAFARTSYNPYTNRRVSRTGVRTPYGSWGKTVTRRGDNWAKAGHRTRGGKTIAGARGSGGRAVLGGYNRRTGEGFKVAKGKNNLFVGKDGGVYRHNGKNWSKNRGKNGWNKTDMKLDSKDRKAIQDRKRSAGARDRNKKKLADNKKLKDRKSGVGGRDRKGGRAALKDRKAGVGGKDRKGSKAALKDRKAGVGGKDRKGSKAALKDRKAGAGGKERKKSNAALKDRKGAAGAKKQSKSAKKKPAARKSTKKAAPRKKAPARKSTKKAAPRKKAPARKTSSRKYASSKNRKSSGSTRSNLNRSHKSRSSGNKRAKSSSRNRSSAKRRSSSRGGSRSRGGGGRRR
ncbi:MAG: hypothetical protein IZT60_04635 [Gammaproteobacteria bacterium]|nr:hypothetical protein [Gammaproteobacteria bacterium]